MSELNPAERADLADALRDGPEGPTAFELGAIAGRAETLGRQGRVRRRAGVAALAAAAVVAAIAVPAVLRAAGDADGSRDPATNPRTSATVTESTESEVPDACLPGISSTRGALPSDPVWLRFCEPPSPAGDSPADGTQWAQVPDGVLTEDLQFIEQWHPESIELCPALLDTPRFRLQVGFADGTTIELSSGMSCSGHRWYTDTMRAFGRHYAAQFGSIASPEPISCPPLNSPGHTDRNGPSAELEVGGDWMPLTAVRGVRCFYGGPPPGRARFEIPATEAEEVRIRMHSLADNVTRCTASGRASSRAYVLEDRTGTRRTIKISGPECGRVSSDIDNGPHGRWNYGTVPLTSANRG